PCLERGSERCVLLRLRWIAGYDVEAPHLLSRCRVVGGDIATRVVFRAAIADHHKAIDHARRARDRVGVVLVLDGIDGPQRFAGRGIELDQTTIERADEHGAFPERHAAIDDIATGIAPLYAGYLRIVGPELLAGFRIERDHLAPRQGDEHGAVRDDRCRLET